MTSGFIDINVLMDVTGKRDPFYEHSIQVWTLAEEKEFAGFVSAISYTTIYYLTRKYMGSAAAEKALKALRGSFTTVPCDAQILNEAMDSGFEDFEDAVQYFSAKRAGAECIITRNQDHFRRADLPVMSPAQFLAAYFPE